MTVMSWLGVRVLDRCRELELDKRMHLHQPPPAAEGQKNPEAQSLMSIVEDVAWMNREVGYYCWLWLCFCTGSRFTVVSVIQPSETTTRMEIVKAPPWVGRDVLERMETTSCGGGGSLNSKRGRELLRRRCSNPSRGCRSGYRRQYH